jgi:Ca-activated chloride channel family protein
MWTRHIKAAATALVMYSAVELGVSPEVTAQQPAAPPTFRSNVELVRVAAVVRDRRGRLVRGLNASDFVVLDGGHPRDIEDFRLDEARISVALLFDISGSMETRMAQAREAATHLLKGLTNEDEVAVFTFDTRLDQVSPFRAGMRELPARLAEVEPFGATSLHDAIAETAGRLTNRGGRRRGVVAFTDGADNASRLTPPEVSAIASAIDVPVYVVGLVPHIDNPTSNAFSQTAASPLGRELADLAMWTGGQALPASSADQRMVAARRILDELRHQYLIAFESSGIPGWRPLVVRTRDRDLTVRARSGYFAGQSRPNSQ